MHLETLHDLFVEQLQDLHSAENQLVEALPKMARAASNDELKRAFEDHLRQTRTHVQRLEQIFDDLGLSHNGKKCKGMEGLLKEGNEMIEHEAAPEVKDAGLIAAAQRVEHYEISAYGTVRTYADQLRYDETADTLQTTLDEEGETDKKLTKIATGIGISGMGINVKAEM
ncbi:MAG: ferritin-like domain-containing protein [Chloroflexi bacterium]|nr:ferritin-like domain-containing protein [Chloroflexota bacterium]MCI0578042.1 ferritin-like domain-containing protein [Chloroflexota bacterium]MCI0644744.1 ferritin-like domain-containing protein [Chloroflexota bacterium]MCI0728649.1 ferritin-like domain-containing protein [Chloroflexota bacterium]